MDVPTRPAVLRILATLIIAAGAVAGCAGAPPPAQPAATRAPVPRDANALASVALGTWAKAQDGPRALEMIARATQREPQRADLAWLHSRLCMEVRSCEPEALESRLRRLDSRNGIAWLGPLTRAQARGDREAEEQILAKMAEAARLDVYWTTLISRLAAAHRAGQGSSASLPLTAALNEITEWLSRITVPAFRALTQACTPPRTHSKAAVAAHCVRIAEAMQRSDTTLAEGIGLGIAQRLATPGSPAAAELDKRIATLGYVSSTAASIVQAQLEREKLSAELLELMQQLPREQDVSRAILRWAGENE